MAHQLGDQRRDILGERIGIGRVVGDMDLAHASDLGGGLRHAVDALPGDDQVDLTQLGRRRDGRQRGILDGPAVMLDPNQRLHLATPNAFSFSTSSSTEPTLTPAWRLPGSATWVIVSRGDTSTP
ncbi:hypothetical protein SPZE110945_19450 [Sphingomonas zeae]